MEPLSPEQIEFVIDCIRTWLETRQQNGYSDATANDVDHSALLRRLLNGKPLLPNPPPVSFSYPWYEILETGKALRCNVLRHRNSTTISIDRDPRWHIVREAENALYVRYQGDGPIYRVWQSDPALDEFGWTIEKVEE